MSIMPGDKEQRSQNTGRMTAGVLLWGMNGVYTWTVLESLLNAGVPIKGVLLDGSVTPMPERTSAYDRLTPPSPGEGDLELLQTGTAFMEQNTVNTAWHHGLPIYAIHSLAASETKVLINSFEADVACVACFPRRFPVDLLTLPRHGFLNVHPSRLPDYRGPAPLFWQLRDGVDPIGVTVHWMDAELDTGDIAAQTSVQLPDGIDGPGADRLLGEHGGQLLAGILSAMGSGQLPRNPQPSGGSYQPHPRVEDFRLEPSWPARRAYNFMRGTGDRGMPYLLVLRDGTTLRLRTALHYAVHERLTTLYHIHGDQASIQFTPGLLVAQLD